MRTFTRRRLILAVSLLALLLATAGILYLRSDSLQSQLPRITVGMTGSEAKQILGPPYLTLSCTNGRGVMFTWGD